MVGCYESRSPSYGVWWALSQHETLLLLTFAHPQVAEPVVNSHYLKVNS